MPRTVPAFCFATTALAVSLAFVTAAPLFAQGGISRRIFVTATDSKEQPLTGLTPAEFELKEGGKDQVIASLEPAKTKMKLVLAFEEAFGPSGAARQAALEFMKQMLPQAEISLVVIGLSNRTLVPFTSDGNALVAALNALPTASMPQLAQVPDGVAEMARDFIKQKAVRPVIVLLALDIAQASTDQPQNILNVLRDSNAMLSVVSLTAGRGSAASPADALELAGRAKVLGDGPKQSGGRTIAINGEMGISRALLQIANDLTNQYEITYALPGGAKPAERVSVEFKRRNTILRAPTRISTAP